MSEPTSSSSSSTGSGNKCGSSKIVDYNKDHYPNGLNHDFVDFTEEDLYERFGKEKGGMFEDAELRDIARNREIIIDTIKKYIDTYLKESKNFSKSDTKQSSQNNEENDNQPVGSTFSFCDVGCGSGLFSKDLDTLVYSIENDANNNVVKGTVYGIEISSGFLSLLEKKKKTMNMNNTIFLQCTVDTVNIQESFPNENIALDVAFMCDVYHHIENLEGYMGSLFSLMKPGGLFVMIDFHRIPELMVSHSPEWVIDHVRADQQTFRKEIEAIGFRYKEEVTIETMQENYFMVFEKP